MSPCMISVGCVLIPGVYIAIELADTLGKSYIAIIKGDRIQKSVGHIMLLQHDCLISELYVYYGTYIASYTGLLRKGGMCKIFSLCICILSTQLPIDNPSSPILFIAAADFLSPTTHTCMYIISP